MLKRLRLVLIAALLAGGAVWLFSGSSYQARQFVGRWESSRTHTPIHIEANGEWEIRGSDGKALQYGLWRLEGDRLIWTIKQGQRVSDDVNRVLSLTSHEFRLREQNGDTTVFTRVD